MKKLACKACRKPKKVCHCGRPLFDGKNKDYVLSKLEEAFSDGATDEEASFRANISISALYRFMADNAWFREDRNRWRLRPEIIMRKMLVQAAMSDAYLGLKYLEAKCPWEFSPRYISQREARDARMLGN